MKVVAGTSGWQYKEWRGAFYPERMKDANMLGFYASHLTALEVNATFRRVPDTDVFARWRSEAPEDFTFILKMPQVVTHYRRLKDSHEPVERLLTAAAPLGGRLGPILVQLHPTMKLDQPRLDDFLASIPAGVRIAVEPQHASWFVDDVYNTLRRHNAALCLVEKDGETPPRIATADWGYLRLRRAEYDDASLRDWHAWVSQQKWTDAAVFFKHENEARGPRFALRFLEILQHSTDF